MQSVARLLCRAYATIIAAFLAGTGSATVETAALMIFAGVVLDVLRNRYALDLTMDDITLARHFQERLDRRFHKRTYAQWIVLIL